MGKADLHIHSTASYGNLEPEKIVSLASQNNLEIISITDHDTIASYERAKETGNELQVEVLSGVELTCDFNDREAHLLGYCFDVTNSAFLNLLAKHRRARLERMEWIVGRITRQGLELDKEEVRAEAGTGNVGRPHVAAVLLKKGYVANAQEAFIRYLGNHALGPIPNFYVSHTEAIRKIKEAGGAAVLAHPGVLYNDTELQQWIDDGLDGLEVVHPSHNYDRQKRYQKLAEHHDLLITGGSDYHGRGEDYLQYFGIVNVGLDRVHRLKRMTEQRKQISV